MTKIYKHKKTGVEAVFITKYPDNRVEMELSDGTRKTYTESTFKRWWAFDRDELDGLEVPSVLEEEVIESEQITDDVNFTKDTFIEYIKQVLVKYGYTLKLWEKLPNIVAFKLGDKTVGEIAVGKASYRINTKTVYAEGIDVEFTTINNYYLPAAVKKIPFTDNIVIRLLDYIVKNTNNSKKG